jgi:hypothetical protein
MEENSKACSKCGEIKIFDDFAKNHSMKNGRSNICIDCNKKKAKSYRVMSKAQKEEDPILKLKKERNQILADLSLDDISQKDFEAKQARLSEIFHLIRNLPTSVFTIPSAIFAEKSSIADSVIQSKLPLFVNKELKQIISPNDIQIQWSKDHSSLRVQLPDSIKLDSTQIASLTTILPR